MSSSRRWRRRALPSARRVLPCWCPGRTDSSALLIGAAFSGSSSMRSSPLLRGWPSFTLNSEPSAAGSSTSSPCFDRASFASLASRLQSSFCLLHELFDERLELVVLMRRDRRRAADDQRRARLIDQDGVHFVDDGEVMAALDLFLLAWWPCRCRAGNRSRTRRSSRR